MRQPLWRPRTRRKWSLENGSHRLSRDREHGAPGAVGTWGHDLSFKRQIWNGFGDERDAADGNRSCFVQGWRFHPAGSLLVGPWRLRRDIARLGTGKFDERSGVETSKSLTDMLVTYVDGGIRSLGNRPASHSAINGMQTQGSVITGRSGSSPVCITNGGGAWWAGSKILKISF